VEALPGAAPLQCHFQPRPTPERSHQPAAPPPRGHRLIITGVAATAAGDGDGVRGRCSPRRGRHQGAPSVLHGFSSLSTFGRATAAPSASSPPWRRRLQRPISACGFAGVAVVRGGLCRWCGKAAGAGGWLEGGCRVLMAAAKIMPAAKGLRSGVGSWLLAADHGGWRCLAIASVVWDCVGGRRSQQRHCGKTRSAADCGGLFCIARRLGRVHRRKMAWTTTWVASMMAVAGCAGGAT